LHALQVCAAPYAGVDALQALAPPPPPKPLDARAAARLARDMALEQTCAVRAALLRRAQGAAEPGDEDMLMVRPRPF
jgi:hypothetical protein